MEEAVNKITKRSALTFVPLFLLFPVMDIKPTLHTSLSPALLHLYEVNSSIIVIIDVFRATSTIATALYNGAKCVIPVDSVTRCIELGNKLTGLPREKGMAKWPKDWNMVIHHLNIPREFIEGKTLVLTTTNGTRLLHMALEKGAGEIITGAFANLSAVCDHLIAMKKNVILGCAAWKDRVNMEDSLFAGAVISKIGKHFSINCDSSHMAEAMYEKAKKICLIL